MDIRKVKKLIELMEDSDIQEIDLKEGEESVRISRAMGNVGIRSVPQQVANPSAAEPAAPSEVIPKGHVIKAPMVGNFYRAPSPNSPPFVEQGQQIREGETVCIIESMKMMNQIQSDKSGVIEMILADNGETVEFDQPLFTIV
jgi:acetyl-CoA carboxylase biotin carboxyl carrier protein|tara:strand:- start:679 stop:1107 length:429 start_codon:yes stop_codon:yes gene_type:complete